MSSQWDLEVLTTLAEKLQPAKPKSTVRRFNLSVKTHINMPLQKCTLEISLEALSQKLKLSQILVTVELF